MIHKDCENRLRLEGWIMYEDAVKQGLIVNEPRYFALIQDSYGYVTQLKLKLQLEVARIIRFYVRQIRGNS